jgi:hypothetical protein
METLMDIREQSWDLIRIIETARESYRFLQSRIMRNYDG